MSAKMKYVIEFGIRGGRHVDNIIIPTRKLAAKIAASISHVFMGERPHDNDKPLTSISGEIIPRETVCKVEFWLMDKNCTRLSWSDSWHFVSMSKLDGVPRGAASEYLWKLNY